MKDYFSKNDCHFFVSNKIWKICVWIKQVDLFTYLWQPLYVPKTFSRDKSIIFVHRNTSRSVTFFKQLYLVFFSVFILLKLYSYLTTASVSSAGRVGRQIVLSYIFYTSIHTWQQLTLHISHGAYQTEHR